MKTRRSLPLLSAALLFFATVTVTPGAIAQTLVNGTPPLTQEMVTRYSTFIAWILEISMTQEQQQQISSFLVETWQKGDEKEIQGALSILEAQSEIAQYSEPEKEQVRQQLQNELRKRMPATSP